MRSFPSSTFTLAVVGLGAFNACVSAEEIVGRPAEDDSSEPREIRPIATLTLATGSIVEFIDLGEGRAGVAEHGTAPAPLVTDELAHRWDATPLEMFIALAPNARVPDLLQHDHAAASDAPPRRLQVPASHGVPIDLFDCDPPENFEFDWHDTYDGVTEVVVAESYYDFPWEQFDWWPGLHAYNGTNTNMTTHLGICGGDPDVTFSVRVDRRITYSVDGVQHVNWNHRVTAGIGYMGRFTFHTQMPGVFRMRLFDPSSTPISQLSAGAAYTKGLPIGIATK